MLVEIAFGIERLPRSKRLAVMQARFDLLCAELPRAEWTDVVSEMHGRVKATLVTANLDHMIRVPGLRIEAGAADLFFGSAGRVSGAELARPCS